MPPVPSWGCFVYPWKRQASNAPNTSNVALGELDTDSSASTYKKSAADLKITWYDIGASFCDSVVLDDDLESYRNETILFFGTQEELLITTRKEVAC